MARKNNRIVIEIAPVTRDVLDHATESTLYIPNMPVSWLDPSALPEF